MRQAAQLPPPTQPASRAAAQPKPSGQPPAQPSTSQQADALKEAARRPPARRGAPRVDPLAAAKGGTPDGRIFPDPVLPASGRFTMQGPE